MPTNSRGYCPECGHEWDGFRRRIACGQVNFREPETYRCYTCARCSVDLCVPRRLNRSSWLRWVSENASELTRSPLLLRACELGVCVDQRALVVITRSPLLFRACERVSSVLAGARSRYVAVPIDIGMMACPDCGDQLTIGKLGADASICPNCESRCARWISEHHPEVIFVDYSPLNDGAARRVILHLKELAAHAKDQHSKWNHDLPTSEVHGPLWDREMDGLGATSGA
jgi:hypothetical protein